MSIFKKLQKSKQGLCFFGVKTRKIGTVSVPAVRDACAPSKGKTKSNSKSAPKKGKTQKESKKKRAC